MVYPAVGPSFLEPLPSRQQHTPTYGAIIDSLSRMENFVGQGAFNYALWLNKDTTPEENFDPYATVWGTKYENSMGAFTKAQNQLDVELIKQRMEQGLLDRDTISKAGAKAIAPMFLIGNLDPTVLLPVGATLKGATTAGTFFKNAARVGAATGAAVGAQEAGLHYLQDFRTREETVGAITSSVILGGMLGGAASLWSGRAFKAAADNVYRELADTDTLPKLIREAEDAGGVTEAGIRSDTGRFRARRELDELAEELGVGDKWNELQLKADYYDQSYDIGISNDSVLNTPEHLLEQILPKQQAKNVSSILLPETLMKIRKQANEPLTQPSLAETNIDLLGDPSVKFTGLDYLESEFESYAKMKFTTDEVDEIIEGLLARGVSRDEIKEIAKRVLRKSVGQKQGKKSTGLLVEDGLDLDAVGESLGKLEPKPQEPKVLFEEKAGGKQQEAEGGATVDKSPLTVVDKRVAKPKPKPAPPSPKPKAKPALKREPKKSDILMSDVSGEAIPKKETSGVLEGAVAGTGTALVIYNALSSGEDKISQPPGSIIPRGTKNRIIRAVKDVAKKVVEPKVDPVLGELIQKAVKENPKELDGGAIAVGMRFTAKNEGTRLKVYNDTEGNPTIGIGHLLKKGEDISSLTKEQVLDLYQSDYDIHAKEAAKIPVFKKLNAARKIALIDMVFTMGEPATSKLKIIGDMERGEWDKAADRALTYLWASQVKKRRATFVTELIRTGDLKAIKDWVK